MSNDSEDDVFGRGVVVEGDESDESDGLDGSDGSDGSNSEADDYFLDLEASEADSESEAELHREENEPPFESEPSSFPQFPRLPPELRQLVWAKFCPDLAATSRVFEFHLLHGAGLLSESATLEQQTRPSRRVLAVHKESRAFALGILPDRFELSHGGLIRFNAERDTVVLNPSPSMIPSMIETFSPTQLQESLGPNLMGLARNVAVFSDLLPLSESPSDQRSRLQKFIARFLFRVARQFPKLKTIYLLQSASDYEDDQIGWSVSAAVNTYHHQSFEDEPGLGEDMEMVYCWPDYEKNRDLAEREVYHGVSSEFQSVLGAFRSCLPEMAAPLGAAEDPPTWEIWPMVRFDFESGLERLEKMRLWDKPWDEWKLAQTPEPSEDESDEDEYEEDFIDDGPIPDDDDDETSGDEDDLTVQHLSDDVSEADEQGVLLDSTAGDEYPPAQFSDSEEESGTDSDAGGEVAGSPSSSRAARSKRRIVADDSDDESVTEMGDPVPSTRKGHTLIVLSDSDDENEEESKAMKPAPRVRRRARALPPDSEDEEGDDSAGGRAGAAQGDGNSETERAEDSEEEDSDEEVEEDEAPPKRMSLAERLRLHAQENPIDDSGSDDGSDAENENGDGDGLNYRDDDDEDDDEDDDDGEGDDPESNMLQNMAEEYGENEEEDFEDADGW